VQFYQNLSSFQDNSKISTNPGAFCKFSGNGKDSMDFGAMLLSCAISQVNNVAGKFSRRSEFLKDSSSAMHLNERGAL